MLLLLLLLILIIKTKVWVKLVPWVMIQTEITLN